MALYGFSLNPCLERVELCQFNANLSTTRIRRRCSRFDRKQTCSVRRKLHGVRCSSVSNSVSSKESQGNDSVSKTASPGDEEAGHVTRFEMSDFMVLHRVSVGLGGRVYEAHMADEVIFEAIVKDSSSPLYNSRVVLLQLTSVQAQRRGRRAIEVLKKLVGRRILYHSYSMQVYGYVSSHKSGSHSSFTLVHGYHGSFSLRHWLQQPNWLPTLESTLALDEESVRRVGDDSVGGPAVSRQLRLIRILMRDLLIGVNYLHCNGIAHTELRLENVHISPVDRHIKVGILGNAADFYENGPSGSALDSKVDRRQMMIAFDMRCVGFMMAKMVLSELMDPAIFTKFKHFLMKNWLEFLPGKWRLLYSTGRHIGLTLRQPPLRALIGNTYLTIERASKSNRNLSLTSETGFTIMVGHDWPHDKRGIKGKLQVSSSSRLRAGKRLYLNEAAMEGFSLGQPNNEKSIIEKLSSRKWRKAIPFTELPSSLPVAKLLPDNIKITMTLNDTLEQGVDVANIVKEIRTQVPPEMFELSNIVCGTYVDSRMLILRGVNGSALIFTWACTDEKL